MFPLLARWGYRPPRSSTPVFMLSCNSTPSYTPEDRALHFTLPVFPQSLISLFGLGFDHNRQFGLSFLGPFAPTVSRPELITAITPRDNPWSLTEYAALRVAVASASIHAAAMIWPQKQWATLMEIPAPWARSGIEARAYFSVGPLSTRIGLKKRIIFCVIMTLRRERLLVEVEKQSPL